jgi:pimeloyl-ACP methyl ester carboxylesterase
METDFYSVQRARASIALWLVAPLLLLGVSPGCALLHTRNQWQPPALYSPTSLVGQPVDCLAGAESQFTAGQKAEAAGNATCIDYYFAAAVQAWPHHVAGCATADDRATELYRSSVQSFIASAVRLGRFQNTQGVVLTNGQFVPITYHGFVWQPADFCQFLPVGTYQSERLETRYAWPGVGMPYVVLTTNPPRHPFTNISQPFAATAVLAPSGAMAGGFALEFYDPLRACTTDAGLPITRDLTAPIAYAASQESDLWLENFVRPGRDDARSGLHMREPFQPGKIPVVLVHGLASDPLTWAQLENDLRAQPAIFNRYQFWFFRYDTGDPFLGSAARLRQQLVQIRQTYDPARCDPNLSQMVVIGHSMGGLLSKLQVTCSGNEIWNAAATRPLDSIVTDPATRSDLATAFYFQPSPDIRRVIYIATPHRGSVEATRCVGRLSSALVKERPEWVVRHEQLVRDNPGAFGDELQRGVPTSVDLLEPDSLILQATDRLPYGRGVALHSVIGDDRWSLGQGRSDGVVAVSSARIGGVQSELVVDAKHSRVQRDQRTVREVICILSHHAAVGECY